MNSSYGADGVNNSPLRCYLLGAIERKMINYHHRTVIYRELCLFLSPPKEKNKNLQDLLKVLLYSKITSISADSEK